MIGVIAFILAAALLMWQIELDYSRLWREASADRWAKLQAKRRAQVVGDWL